MAMVVTKPCEGCKYTDCVVVCPCDCFREGEEMHYIFPDDCIDCGACIPECPTEAIYHESEVPEPWRIYIEWNRQRSISLPMITERKARSN